MSEEKKLDEKALEEVSGGTNYPPRSEPDRFQKMNCVHCRHYIHHTCPYGSITDAIADAIKELGKISRCPKWVTDAW